MLDKKEDVINHIKQCMHSEESYKTYTCKNIKKITNKMVSSQTMKINV